MFYYRFQQLRGSSSERGPRIVPCSTPHLSKQILEREPLTRHRCVRLDKYDLNQSRAVPCIP